MSLRPKLIKDPIHGYIELDPYERRIVDSRPMQRLRRICQLPLASLVYPGANHTRFDHSLGSFKLAGEIAQKLSFDEAITRAVKYAALLHDVGHTPYSHLLEHLLFEKETNHERMGVKIIKESQEICSAIEESGIDVVDVTNMLERKRPESIVVIGPVDADKLDFIARDSFFAGATYGVIDTKRLIHMMRLVNEKLAVNVRALGAVEEFALARLQSFMNIYFHHAIRAAQTLLFSAVVMLSKEFNFGEMDVEEYLRQDDMTVWCKMKATPKTSEAIDRIERRKLPKRAFEMYPTGEKLSISMFSKRDMRNQIGIQIADMAGVSRDKIWIDTPYMMPLPLSTADQFSFYREKNGETELIDVRSPITELVAEAYNIVRIYTEPEYRERVGSAAKKFFELPEVTGISY